MHDRTLIYQDGHAWLHTVLSKVDICNIAVFPRAEFTDTILLMGTSMTAHYLIQCFFVMDLMLQVFVLFHLYHKCMVVSESEWGTS